MKDPLFLLETKIGPVYIRNRIAMSPMCMYSAEGDGKVTPFHLQHYASRAFGGVGLIIVEATGVQPEGRITDRDLGIWEDGQIFDLAQTVQQIHAYGAKAAIQLAHAGRKSECAGLPKMAPSELDFNPGVYPTPQAMSDADIQASVKAFGEGARRADAAGFDAIEIHAAHGYLIHQFLSPLSNHRKDQWGGSAENRLRFLREVLREIRLVWPAEKAILVRFSATDWLPGGLEPEDIAGFINDLNSDEETAFDAADISSGGLLPAPITTYPGYQRRFAADVKRQVDIPVMTVGLYNSGEGVEHVLREGDADLVALGRLLLNQPYWVLNQAAKAKREDLIPESHWRGFRF